VGSILDHVSFLLNIVTAAIIAFQWESTGICWNLLESAGNGWNVSESLDSNHFQRIPVDSNGFQWKPFWEAPGFQLIPVDSIGFCWNFHGIGTQNG